MSHNYANRFFDEIGAGSQNAARVIVPRVAQSLNPSSVLDIGCGQGVWLAAWHAAGITDLLGVDGDYIDRARLAIPVSQFQARDLAAPLDFGRRFDLVMSLEVAEHLPESAAEIFIDNLTWHGNVILFSAAVPGQGGEFHVNEQPLEYWRAKFAARGYCLFDAVRPGIKDNPAIEAWYRYNMMLFVQENFITNLPDAVRRTKIPQGQDIPDFSSFLWRLRCTILRCLPQAAHGWLRRVYYACREI